MQPRASSTIEATSSISIELHDILGYIATGDISYKVMVLVRTVHSLVLFNACRSIASRALLIPEAGITEPPSDGSSVHLGLA